MNTQYNSRQSKWTHRLSTVHCPLSTIRSGMTLVELLVAVSIMVLLVAVSVPMFKPMLDSQKSAGGARTVALALQRARVMAMETGQPCGIMFERFIEGNENNVSVRLFLVKPPKPYTGDVGEVISVDPFGTLTSYPSSWASANIQNDDYIQFNYQGKYYKVNGGSPQAADGTKPPEMNNVPFRVLRSPQTGAATNLRMALAPSIIMPRGTVVDLQYSGIDHGTVINDRFPSDILSIIVMFAPTGSVDRVYYGGTNDIDDVFKGPIRLIHFCVGEWERGISVGHEDGRNNIQTASNFWVTVNPRTGEVRTTEMNPVPPGSNDVTTARKFARERFVNIGGF